ncbi:insulinase family protein [Holosporaceae bacterium 'Namur']|nr:insulinase family protein [Holosporaceae bacterium 'Namur']
MNDERNFCTLENGMMVAFDQMKEVETVAISVLMKTGSKFEKKEQSGISHFLEHMAFKGTNTRTAKQIAEEFDMIGGYFNAYTSREKTVYYAKVLKDDIDTAVDILSDILQNSSFSVEEIDKERKVVLQEMAQTKDTPDDIIFDNFQEAAFPDQPLGRSILGEEEIIKSLSRDQIIEYVNSRYGFNNVIVSAAGNFDVGDYNNLIKSKFNLLPGKSENLEIKSDYRGGESRINKDLEQVHFVLGFEGVSYYDDDYYTQQALSIIAGGGMSSRLFQEVRENRGLAYSISAFGSNYADNGIFGIYSSSSDYNINELVDVVIAELHKMLDSITEEEVKRAKAQVRAGLLMSRENPVSRAEKFASNLSIYGRYVPITEVIDKVNAIDPSKVQKYLRRILSNNKQPTISSIGKIDKLYQYDTIKNKLKV